MFPIDQCNEIETFKEVLSGLVVPIFMSKPPAAPLMERGWPRGPSVDISKQFLLSPNLSRLNLFSGRRGGGLEVIQCGFRRLLCHPLSLLQIKNRGKKNRFGHGDLAWVFSTVTDISTVVCSSFLQFHLLFSIITNNNNIVDFPKHFINKFCYQMSYTQKYVVESKSQMQNICTSPNRQSLEIQEAAPKSWLISAMQVTMVQCKVLCLRG